MSYSSKHTGLSLENVIENSLLKNNSTTYTPSGDYNPTTKKYVEEYVTNTLQSYVQKVSGKDLSTNDFTNDLMNKLNGLENYDDTTIKNSVQSLQNSLNTLTQGDATSAIESFNEIIAFLKNTEDTETLEGIIASLEQQIAAKYSKPSGGIPKSDLESAVQASLSKADTSLQKHQSLDGYVKDADLATVATSGSYDDLTNIPTKITNLRSYTTATTVASLKVNYENIYVTLSANASLSASGTGTTYNGRTITAYVYTAAARTITIPTTGNYISMCGSSYTTTAGGWVEFNLTCIAGKWHIAKLEQE